MGRQELTGGGDSRPELAPEVARQHTSHRGKDDEQPECGTGSQDLSEEVVYALGQV